MRVAVVQNGTESLPGSPYYDPGLFSYSPLNRCCLTRTLLSYKSGPIEAGGAELRPDLAADLPHISADGLTWEFTLRPGLHYAPPLADRAIEARDFITAAEHSAHFVENPPFLQDIVGFQEFIDGSVDSIAGIEAPDSTTIRFRLSAPAGDFGHRVALSLLAPIPEEALEGREDADYAGFIVSSGPYMYEGADDLDLTDPDALPIWNGRDLGRATLVRNPSWSRATDPLRPAHADRIEVVMVSDADQGIALIESGDADVLGEPAPLSVAQRYLGDDALRTRVFSQSGMRLQYLSMNLAQPPFDDVHVRRAVNLVVDRGAAARAIMESRNASAVVARHVFPDATENALLRAYDPYPSKGDNGNRDGARHEMRQSGYDADGDGRCDAEVCSKVPAVAYSGDYERGIWPQIVRDLATIGIELVPAEADFTLAQSHVAAVIDIGWGADYPSGANFSALVGRDGISDGGLLNLSLMGASADELTKWGYAVTDVPSLDDKLNACKQAVGSAAFLCWAELDQLITERVAAWVPLAFIDHHWIFSQRVTKFSPEGDSVTPALDQIRLRPED